ncbi:bacteriohemerythrin [Dyella solisilvae]|uniref:Bacteriohemerythrin n=1 Tax=Dyella solisilvae TaxID=1920168 RepID=A0A370K3H9_9GAMM|nr:bacteriohemerythrin [Dyella solisilvae]RDI97201.1 bacteriohemerythrin [Dyella solisilvae]
MTTLEWREDLNTGIEVIDNQHRRIVAIANALQEARENHDRQAVGEVLEELVDYTLSHFTFEEALMEDAGYEFDRAHKRLHEIFVAHIRQYQTRFQAGEDVADELKRMLSRWLFQHIRNDDQAYVDLVKRNMLKLTTDTSEGGWLQLALKRFFRGRAA